MNRKRLFLTVSLLLMPSALAQTTPVKSPSVTANTAVTAAVTNNADVKTAQANLDKAQAANRAA
ncbi:hypothetical protein ORD21_10265, partial [Deinococcus sp. ZS9-10]|nr:hypothetical protein [Deinococcus sp. ZS9-10]